MAIFDTCQTGGHIVHNVIMVSPLLSRMQCKREKNGTKRLEFSQ